MRASDPSRYIVHESAEMSAVVKQLQDVAACDAPVLLIGERGSGRELIARAIHGAGERRGGRFVALRAASMSGTVLTSELSDHATGKLRRAHRGTLLLKEISALPRAPQRLLTRVLRKQAKLYERTERGVDTSGDEAVDVRLIAATDADLDVAASHELFEPELAERLGALKIQVPPLRRRVADIPILAEQFAARTTDELGRAPVQLSSAALDKLAAYSWPGNVAELKDVVRRVILRARRNRIDRADVDTLLPQARIGAHAVHPDEMPFEEMVRAKLAAFLARFQDSDTIEDLYQEVIGRVERPLISLVLERAAGNQLKAAKVLGLNRNTLRKKITCLGLGAPAETRPRRRSR